MKPSFLVKGSLTALVLLLGCSIDAVAANSTEVPAPFYSRIRGGVRIDFEAPFEDVTRAVSKAIEKLRFTKEKEKSDALVAVFHARTADDTKIVVRLSKLSDKSTRANIQAGVMGDETITRTLIEKIKAEL